MRPPRKALLLRLPPELHVLLKTWALVEARSVTAQIEQILRRAVLRRYRRTPHEAPQSPQS